MSSILGSQITLEGVTGVGTVSLDFMPDQRVYTLIGANGIGKTKTLESLFQILLSTQETFTNTPKQHAPRWEFVEAVIDGKTVISLKQPKHYPSAKHQLPVVLVGSQHRGFITADTRHPTRIGSLAQRRGSYFDSLLSKPLVSLNMDSNIEGWFIMLAQSSNPYQKQEDNREVEIKTVMRLISQIDYRIDPDFLEISGDGQVSLKIEGQKRELSHLSTGFASILKMIQAIVSGYGYFTNEVQLQKVKGIVLIDEIESHLHLSWQANIIPLLKRLFPNTTFYITTHSSIVLSQLSEGEAYRMQRDENGVVRTHLIKAPNKAALVDVMEDAFGIDLNRLKLDSISPDTQRAAKQELLDLLKQQWGEQG
jgi:predicted ATP-binding protein involved in virulence